MPDNSEHHSVRQPRDPMGRWAGADSFDARLAALVKELAPDARNQRVPQSAPERLPLSPAPLPPDWFDEHGPHWELIPTQPPTAPPPAPGDEIAMNGQPVNALAGPPAPAMPPQLNALMRGQGGTQSGLGESLNQWLARMKIDTSKAYGVKP